LPHVPQLLDEVAVFVSHPLATFLSQLPQPVEHSITHTEL
jgi:hypothetical protein